MEPLKQYVFMFVTGGQARGHCKVQCVGGSARIQVQVRLEVTEDSPPLLAVFDAGGNAYMAGALRKAGMYFTLVTDIGWLPQAVCTGAVISDGSGAILLSAGKVPYDAARALQKAMGISQAVNAEDAFSSKGPKAPHKPKPAPMEPVKPMPPKPAPMPSPIPKPVPVEPVEPMPPRPAPMPPPMPKPAPPPPIMEEMPAPPSPPMPESPQYWWQEPRCPYMEMQPPPPEMQPGCEEPRPSPPDFCDPSNRMQDMQPEFIPAQPQHDFDSTGFFTGMQEGDLPSGVVSCPAAALHQADPFHGGEFAGWSWCKVQYEGLHWHYLIGENKTGQGMYSRAVGVPGQYSLRPPPHLKGFDRFAVSRDGTGYWLYFEKDESGT